MCLTQYFECEKCISICPQYTWLFGHSAKQQFVLILAIFQTPHDLYFVQQYTGHSMLARINIISLSKYHL